MSESALASSADCPPGSNIIVGTAGDDVLSGTNGADCILGLAGNDTIDARNGSDTVFGGSGDDVIDGSQHSDALWGEDGNDTIRGGQQEDAIHGGPGDDALFGDQHGDQLFGDDGDDLLDGGNGGGDVMHGGAGCDRIEASNGPDTAYGDDGNDIIDGGHAPDRLHGGAGDDRIAASGAPAGVIFGDDGTDACAGTGCEQPAPATCTSSSSCGAGLICILPPGVCAASSFCAAGLDGGMDAALPTDGGADAPEPMDGGPTCTPTGADTTCNGVDEDCDGQLDEGYVSVATSCGIGACAATGTTSCTAGAVSDSCVAGTPAESDATCDGIDDECNGTADEDYVPVATSCGVGVCGATGSTSCVAGAVVDSCLPGTAGASDATCDGLDDDCSGAADEDFVTTTTGCGVGACGATGSTSCVSGAIVDSCAAGSPAASDATCDGIDDDCSGAVDEDYLSVATSCGVGACGAAGATSCSGGAVIDSCSPGAPAANDATCNGVDDDCSGTVDEDYASVATTCGIGACASAGATSCVAAAVADSCAAGSPAASDATCDAIDDDCNAVTDEDYVSVATTCGVGACSASGATSCVAGAVDDSCSAGTPAASDATCDAVDDDCNGTADEDYVVVATDCGIGACSATGATSCVAGSVSNSCSPGTPAASDATCDSIDDDCNGTADEDYASLPTTCGVGACSVSGATSCVAGAVNDSCSAGAPAASDATCDAIDDDCNGTADEDYVVVATDCGIGACSATGATSCVAGSVNNSCSPGTPAASDATCDAIDDDCNGTADEDYASLPTTCGVGACSASGATSCVAGSVSDSCSAGAPAANDATCDGIDDDCNATADEDYLAIATSCGVGACSAAGVTSCVAGSVGDSCAAGTPAASDSTCDGIDDDCNAATDEDYAPAATACGVGACSSTGVTSCAGGTVSNSCAPGTPAASDATCNGIDDDCNAATDEDYVAAATSCGVGACSASGTTSCIAGSVSDSCSPGTPAASDATCNAIDDDCNGATDEGYVSTATSCGIGACGAAGTTSCIAGSVNDSCSPGTPAASDATCNAIDDDCNGATDEDYASLPTSCGIGSCYRTGATACVGGGVTDSCSAGAPSGIDATCDGLDDDCDALTDEAFAPTCAGSATVHCASGARVSFECSDADACTGIETCDAAACVAGTPPTIDDGNACTTDSCAPATGVSHTAVANGTSCSDSNACNGPETCSSGTCSAGTPPTVDDGNACTTDACDSMVGVTHDFLPDGASCDDGDACNGIETCDGAGYCLPGLHPLSGPCAPAAPVARIFVDEERDVSLPLFGASIVSYTGSFAPTSSTDGISWNPSAVAGGAAMVIDLAGSEMVALERLRLRGNGTSQARHIEISVSRTGTAPADFTVAFTGETPVTLGGEVKIFAIAPAGTAINARYVRIRILDAWNGLLNQGALSNVMLFTRPRDGGALSVFEAGATVTATSTAAGSAASRATDASTATFWQSNAPIASQALTVDLLATDWQRVDRFRVYASGGSGNLRNFEIWGSSTGSAPADFTFLMAGTQIDLPNHWFFVPEANLRFVQLRTLTNAGYPNGVTVNDFQTLTPHEGGITVPFQSRSIVGGTPVVAYRWDFGDGTTSSLENPTHTFPAPGAYIVSLEVQDEWGLVSSTDFAYYADAPPVADFTYTPAAPTQSQSVVSTDRSTPGDAPLIRAEWTATTSASVTTTGTSTVGGPFTVGTAPTGPLSVTVTAVDAHFLRASMTRVISIADGPPTINVGADQTLYWGQSWQSIATPSVTDPGGTDAATLSCHYDFGDGATAEVTNCSHNGRTFYRDHAWALPGDYEVVVTVTDSFGVSAEDRFFVEVIRRPTFVTVDPVPGASSGGAQPVTARLADGFDAFTSPAGRSIALGVAASTATATTDATGVATASLDFGTGAASELTASFAGDTYYTASSTALAVPEAATPTQPSNCGTEFWFALPGACLNASCTGTDLESRTTLSATGPALTMIDLDVAGAGLHASFQVGPSGVARITLPELAELDGSGTRDERAVHVTSPRVICLGGSTYQHFSTDSFLPLPAAHLGTSYVVGAYPGSGGSAARSQIGIVGTVAGTVVTITPTAAMTPGPNTPAALPAGTPFTVTLGRGQAIQLRALSNTLDLTGTLISATAPIAVAGGSSCAFVVGSACDYLVEQLLPISNLGSDFIVPPFGGRTGGYVLRVASAAASTEVRLDGTLVSVINAGQFYELNVTTQAGHRIETTHPALVMQYAKGFSSDGALGDPFMTTVIPTRALGHDFSFAPPPTYTALPLPNTTIIDYTDWVTLVARASEVGGVRFDGAPVGGAWLTIGTSDYAYNQFTTTNARHRVQHLTPGASVGAYTYGWATFESYGNPAYMRLVPDACSPTTSVAGDGIDNECDGLIDEETANGIDDDGDTLVDEDLDAASVTAVNVAPVAYDGRIGTREDVPVSFVLSGFDPNGDALSFQVLTTPASGTLTGTAPNLTYTPVANANGLFSLTFRVCDPSLACSPAATFELEVRGVNDPPFVSMSPVVNALEDAVLTLPCVAGEVDVDLGCELTWTLVSGPPGMTIDAGTADIFWIPPAGASSVSVTVRVTDCHGASSTFTFGIAVAEVFDPPFISSRPPVIAMVGRPYSYDVNVVDADVGDTATFQFNTFPPSGMTMTSGNGLISWTPTPAQAGMSFVVEVIAIDSHGLLSSPQRFEVRVAGDTTSPTIALTATPPSLVPDGSSVVHAAITDDLPGSVLDAVTINGSPITLDGSGNYTFTSATPGVFEVIAAGHDAATNLATATTTIRVLDASDLTGPVVSLTSPEDDEVLTYLHDAIGSVFDDHLHRWTLDMRRADRGAYFTVASGRANITGTLGQIDTTQLENGIYILRLRAEDVNGAAAEVTRPVRIDGGAKIGVVQLSFTDLVLDAIGIPLAVVRSYDSRRAETVGDFGNGWSLDVRLGSVQRNRAVGDGFAITTNAYPFSLPCQAIYEQQYHYVLVQLSEDDWYTFRPVMANVQQVSGHCTADVAWEQVDGVHPGAELLAFGNTTVQATALPIARGIPTIPSYLTDLTTGEIYDPHRFELRLRDGRSLVMSWENGVESIQDANGNFVVINSTGMVGGRGESVQFVRDARGRITQIMSGARSVGYEYSASGNLTGFTDTLARCTSYEYGAAGHPHHLTDIIDWRGNRAAAMDYQADGRLSQICDPEGVCLRSTYDLTSRVMQQVDGLGVPTQYEYDRQGNVILMRDGLGHETTYTYHAGCGGHNLATETDPLGNVTTETYHPFTCDRSARIEPHLATENAALFTTSWTYDAGGRVLTETLPSGGTHHHAYDAAGNELSLSDDNGNVIFGRTYDTSGRLLSQGDRFGTTDYVWGSSAHPISMTDAQGRTHGMRYDSDGHVISIYGNSDGSSSPVIFQSFRYDAAGRMLFADYGRGVTVTYAYEDAGNQWTRISGPTFGTVSRRFSASGRLVGWTMPNGDTFARSYDAAGRLRSETNELGNATTYAYDDAGRLESATDVARAATTTYLRDDAGRVLSTTDPLGHTSSRTYDVRGAMASMTDALTHTWTFSTNPLTSTSTTPLGETTTTTSTNYGLPASTTFPGGAATGTTHEGVSPIEESYRFPSTRVDESGRTRSFGYDANSGLTSATDVGGNAWAYTYEPILAGDVSFDVESGRVSLTAPDGEADTYRFTGGGNPTTDDHEALRRAEDLWQHALETVTSPGGEVTTYGYDTSGHRNLVVLPNGGIRTMSFMNGHLDIETLPFGTTLEYTRDAAFRVTERTGSDGSLQAFTYGAGDRVETIEDDTGATDYVYDAAGRFAGLDYPTGGSVHIGRDALDQITSVAVEAPLDVAPRTTTYVRDAANHITEIHDPLGGVTYQTYDLNGRLSTRTLPNGVVSTYTYDARGWSDTIVHARADHSVIASVDYSRSPSGEPTRIDREDGTYVLYDYDDALRLTGEHYRDAGGGILENIAYIYDGDGNRTTRITSAGIEHYTYDAGSELRDVTMGTTTVAHYDYDDAGRVIRRVRGSDEQELTYDADDHLVRIADPAGTNETLWDFDAAGRRTRREDRTASVTTGAHRYLVAPTLEESLESPHAVTTEGGGRETSYVFDGEYPLFRHDEASGEVVYYLRDTMGSTIALVDASATAHGTIQYDGFGNEVVQTGALAALPTGSAGDFRFQGMWFDIQARLYYARARLYDQHSGRFLSHDSVPEAVAAPFHGPYVFAAGAPTVYRDPSGQIELRQISAAAVGFAILAFRAIAVPLRILGALSLAATFASIRSDDELTPEQAAGIGLGLVTYLRIRVPSSWLLPIVDRAAAACGRFPICSDLAAEFIRLNGSGRTITLYPQGRGMLPLRPGIGPAGGWSHHVAVLLDDGRVVDPFRRLVFSSREAFVDATVNAPVTVLLDQ